MKIDTLKQQAREHELSEEWEQALSLYRRAVSALEESEEPDIALLNRMADLQVRSGDLEGALESYEEAIELYLESDLPNNAIAICRKMIRNAPGRPEIFRRMGEIRARQGFVVDARQNYLTYAEMMEARGERDEALEGLDELVTLLPDDVETRIFLGEHLAAGEEPEAGVPHLLHAWQVLMRGGQEDRAAEIEERIRSLDPAARFPDPVSDPDPDPEPESFGSEPSGRGLEGFETTGLGTTGDALSEVESASPGDSTDVGDDIEDPFPDEGFEIDDSEWSDEALDVEPDPEVDDGDRSDRIGVEADGSDDEVPESAEPLPLLTSDDPLGDDAPWDTDEEEADRGSVEWIRARIAESPEDPDRHEELVEYAYRTNDRDLLLGAFIGLAGALDRRGSTEKARSVYEQVLQLDPRNSAALEALGRPAAEPLDDAFEDLEDFEDPFEAVADVDDEATEPSFDEATEDASDEAADASDEVADAASDEADVPAAGEFDEIEIDAIALDEPASDGVEDVPIATDTPEESPSILEPVTPDEEAPGETGGGFIDLGAMILDDEETGTTRWVAPGHEPSGDEDMDFAGMLADFKDKVARNLDHEDSQARYDLGAAYKEMGLLDEAIAMFQAALRARPGHLGAIEMMGQCFLDRDEPGMAVRVLSRALELDRPIEDDLLGIYYYLGEAHERTGNPDEAREFYEKVFALDINFKDVTERLRSLI